VEFINNNWFSLTMVLPNDELVDMLDFDFNDDIEEAIKRVVLSMEELIND